MTVSHKKSSARKASSSSKKIKKVNKSKKKYNKLKKYQKGGVNDENDKEIINDSQIVIVCHCKKEHDGLFFYDFKTEQKISDNLKNTSIKFIDPTCKDYNWGQVEENSIQYVWGVSCPVYMKSEILEKDILDIINNAGKALRPTGCLVFPINNSSETEKIENHLTYFQSLKCNNIWKITVQSAENFPFYINKSKKHPIIFAKYLYIFEKIS